MKVLRGPLAAVLCFALVTACDGTPKSWVDGPPLAAAMEEIPMPDEERFGELWRQRVAELRGEIDASLEGARVDPARVGDAFGALGRHFMAHHQTESARVCFENARRADADNPSWPYFLGFLHQIQDQFEQAVAAYRTVLKIDPERQGARIRLAGSLLDSGAVEGVEELLIGPVEGGAELAQYHLARLRLEQGRESDAVDLLRQVVAAQPQAGAASYMLGQALRRQGETEEASRFLARTDGRLPSYPDPLLAELSELGVTPEFYRMRGEAALTEGRFQAATEMFEQAVDLGGDDAALRLGYGMALQGVGRLDAAQQQLKAALSAAGDAAGRAEIHHRLGKLLAERGDLTTAVQHQRRALEQAPDHLQAAVALADLSARSGRLPEAVEGYGRLLSGAASEGPMRAQLLVKRGTALLTLGRHAEGLNDLRQAWQSRPEDLDLGLRWIDALERTAARDEAAAAVALLSADSKASPELSWSRLGPITRLAHKQRRYGLLDAAEVSYRRGLDWLLAQDEERRASDLGSAALRDLRLNLADLLLDQDDPSAALQLYSDVLAMAPPAEPEAATSEESGDAQGWASARRAAQAGEVRSLIFMAEWRRAKDKARAYWQVSNSGQMMHWSARLMALEASADADPSDSEAALELARQVFSARRSPEHAATLGMALAASGRFDEASRWHRQLIDDLSDASRQAGSGVPASEARLRWLGQQLEAYRAGKLWRPSPAAEFFEPKG